MVEYYHRFLLHFSHFRSQVPTAPPSGSADGPARHLPCHLAVVASRCHLPWTVAVAASIRELRPASVAHAFRAVADGGHQRIAVVRGGRVACSAEASSSWDLAAGASSRPCRALVATSVAVAVAKASPTWWWHLAAVEVTAATAWQPNLVVISYYLVIGMLAVGPGASALRPGEAACLVLHMAAARSPSAEGQKDKAAPSVPSHPRRAAEAEDSNRAYDCQAPPFSYSS